jgi:hypothetical protein
MAEFFKTVFFELRNKLRRRRIRREHEAELKRIAIKERERDLRKEAIQDEIATRRAEHAITVHDVPDNPYEEE